MEGLPSYVLRLAGAHQVLAQTLLAYELFPTVPAEVRTHKRHFWMGWGNMLTCPSMAMEHAVAGLEQLTGRQDLAALTIARWHPLVMVARKPVMRRSQAWCAQCYAAWHATGQPLYYPLIWSLATATVCDRHSVPLQERCASCQRTVPFLSSQGRPGYCPTCRKAVWQDKAVWEGAISPWERWCSQQLGALLAVGSTAERPRRNQVPAILQQIAGSLPAPARQNLALQVSPTPGTLAQWTMGRSVPHLDQWLRVAALVGTSLVAAMTHPWPGTVADSYPRVPPVDSPPARRPRQRMERAQVEAHLRRVLADPGEPPPSMRAVGKALGHHDTLLRTYFPELCRAISARYVESRRQGRPLPAQEKGAET